MKLSIITPTFNRATVIARNFESVLGQGIPDLEHVIVDNCSEDGTDRLVESYKKSAAYEVVYIRERDSGMYNAINKGIAKARGEWIHILNSDDAYCNNGLVEAMGLLSSTDADVLALPILFGSNASLFTPVYNTRLRHFRFPHPGMIVRAAFYKPNRLYREEFRIVSDAVWGAEHLFDAKIAYGSQPLVAMAEGGLSTTASKRYLQENLRLLWKFHRFPLWNKIIRTLEYIVNHMRGRV